MSLRDVKRRIRAKWMMARRSDLSELGIEPPAVFQGDKPKPLAIGTWEAFLALVPEGRQTRARRFIYGYTQSEWYLWQCVKPGSMRHALNGEPVEPVSDRHREHAERLARSRRRRRLARATAGAQT